MTKKEGFIKVYSWVNPHFRKSGAVKGYRRWVKVNARPYKDDEEFIATRNYGLMKGASEKSGVPFKYAKKIFLDKFGSMDYRITDDDDIVDYYYSEMLDWLETHEIKDIGKYKNIKQKCAERWF